MNRPSPNPWLLAALLAGAALAAAGCRPDPVPPAGAGDIAPIPYPAERIRAATGVGRTYLFAVTLPNGQTARRQLRFAAVDAQGGTIESTMLAPDGAPLGVPEVKQVTWTELESHAHFPAAATEVTEETVETPAGRFEAALYTVREEGKVARYWFAKDLPGAPVRLVEEGPDGATFRMELLRHTPGAP